MISLKNGVLIFLIGIVFFNSCKHKANQDLKINFEEEWFLQTEDRTNFLYIKEVGTGTPVIVIHGGPGVGHRSLLNISDGLTDKFKFIFYDQRGFGFSTVSDSVSMQHHIEDIESIRKAYNLDKIDLISHSFGTMMTMNYLEKYPDRARNIVMLGALDPKNGDINFFTESELKLFENKNEEASQFYNRKKVMDLIDSLGLNKENRTSKEENIYWNIRQSTANIYDVSKWRQLDRLLIDNYKASSQTRQSTNFRYDWSDMLTNHPFPITVINGIYDFEIGPKGSPIWKRVVASEAKNVNLILLDSASHHSWIDKPIKFKTILEKALHHN